MAWLIGRTQTNGTRDYTAVHAIQDQYKLVPLSARGKPATATTQCPRRAGPRRQDAAGRAGGARWMPPTFFGRLNALMQDNPPTAADATGTGAVRGHRGGAGQALRAEEHGPGHRQGGGTERRGRAGAASWTRPRSRTAPRSMAGRSCQRNTGQYGIDYIWRAVVALVGLGANLPADASYPHATVDAQGQPLTGANRYVIRFPKGQLPPVNAFWSITMYNAKQAFVQNPIGRYAIGDRDQLTRDADGSVPIYVQHESPGKDKEANWLPAPADSFNLFMRLYWPKKEIVEGTWKMPPVEGVK